MNRRGFLLVCALTLVLLIGFISGCKRIYTTRPADEPSPSGADLTAAQQISVRQELDGIENFIKRTGWQMEQTPTGLWVDIYESAPQGSPKVEYGNAVKISYTLQLLNGTQTEECGGGTGFEPRTYILGESEIISGLLEGLLLLHKGDKARLLIPSHLAYGFSGNGDKIPPRATLLYDLKVEDILIRPQF